MAAFARWTNLSETTFLLAPTHPAADYRLRIWTPGGELPFAGHPTLASAHAWLETGGVPRSADVVVQECDAGLVTVRRDAGPLAFAAPPLVRSVRSTSTTWPASPARSPSTRATSSTPPGSTTVPAGSASCSPTPPPSWRASRTGRPSTASTIGLVGPYAPGGDGDADVEVRAFCPGLGVLEDPVTGSLNAGLAQWLAGPASRRRTSPPRAPPSAAAAGSTSTSSTATSGSAAPPPPSWRARPG